MTEDILAKLDTFTTLEQDEITLLYKFMKKINVSSGEILFREGDTGDCMYIVLKGIVAVSISVGENEEMEVSRIDEGSFFGEMSIIEQDIRSATCRAVKDCLLLSLNDTSFRSLIEDHPHIAIKIMVRMLNTATNRLQNTGAFLSDMVRWGEEARIRAITDEMTGLYNRRFFDEALKVAITDAGSSNVPMSLVMLDIDKFGQLNKEYGEDVGDRIILAVCDIFRDTFDEHDILIRYGGDEFSFILPDKNSEVALTYCNRVVAAVRKIDILNGLEGSFKHPGVSVGIATFPQHGSTVANLITNADKALYASKEAGRNQATIYNHGDLPKLSNFSENNDAEFANSMSYKIIQALIKRNKFLISGHSHIDGDCLFSISALALALGDIGKSVTVFLNHDCIEKIPGFKEICTRHSVNIALSLDDIDNDFDTVITCDTAKPSMLEISKHILDIAKNENTLVIEIDHHLNDNRQTIGKHQLSLVEPVSSTCEIIGCLLNKMANEQQVIKQLNGKKLISLDVLESIIAGIESDTKKGKLFKNQEEETHYLQLYQALNNLPADETNLNPNIQQIAKLLDTPSQKEYCCLQDMKIFKKIKNGICWVALDEKISQKLWIKYDSETIISVARYLTDLLAQESQCLGLVVYYDDPEKSDMIQFRMRRDKSYKDMDLHEVIAHLKIEDGGGHSGAIGFRLQKNKVTDFSAFMNNLIDETIELKKNN